jgi:hypothetical protein
VLLIVKIRAFEPLNYEVTDIANSTAELRTQVPVLWTEVYNAADVGITGDLAWHAGSSSVIDGADKTVETDKYIEIWHRIDGTWLMVRDICNDDAPPAPEPAK